MRIILTTAFVISSLLGLQQDLSAQAKTTSTKKSAQNIIKECQRPSNLRTNQQPEYQPMIADGVVTSSSNEKTGAGNGTGLGYGRGDGTIGREKVTEETNPLPPAMIKVEPNADVSVYSKPRAVYTPEAKAKSIQGEVVLRVTFLATGKIGKISVVKGLPMGLTKQAKEAAAKIKFEPARQHCADVTIRKNVVFNFILY